MKGRVWFEYGTPLAAGAALFFVLLACEVLVLPASVLGAVLAGMLYLGVSVSDEIKRLQIQLAEIRSSLEAAKGSLRDRGAVDAINRLLETLDCAGRRIKSGEVESSVVKALSQELELFKPLSAAAGKYVEYGARDYPNDKQLRFIESFPAAIVDFSNRLADRIDDAVEGSSSDSVEYIVAALDVLRGL